MASPWRTSSKNLESRIFPCKDCTKREIGCHSHCEDYIQSREKHKEVKGNIEKNKAMDRVHKEYVIAQKARRG